MRRRLGVPLAAAILATATALPAVAAKPEPTVEVGTQVDLAAVCVVDLEITVPVGGKRVAMIEIGDNPLPAERFLNGEELSVEVVVPGGTESIEVDLFDPRGRQVYRVVVPVTCEGSAPPPPAT
jgi:hypothetical protein